MKVTAKSTTGDQMIEGEYNTVSPVYMHEECEIAFHLMLRFCGVFLSTLQIFKNCISHYNMLIANSQQVINLEKKVPKSMVILPCQISLHAFETCFLA